MPGRKHKRTPGESVRQSKRTHKNKMKKYLGLIVKYPTDLAKGIWQKKSEHSRGKI